MSPTSSSVKEWTILAIKTINVATLNEEHCFFQSVVGLSPNLSHVESIIICCKSNLIDLWLIKDIVGGQSVELLAFH